MRLQDEVRSIVEREGVIARRNHPELASAMAWLVRRGGLGPVLPGVFCFREVAASFEARACAIACADPAAILTGATAARLTFWPGLASPDVECAVRWERTARPGGGDGIDRALRTRMTTLDRMWSALELTPGRPGNRDRRWMLLYSRDEPWSGAERLCHRLLRAAGIVGWQANLPVVLRDRRYFLDVAFPALRLVVEIDGRLHEDDREVFENDRWRQNALVLEGWQVLRFTWRMLEEHPDQVVAAIREKIASIRSAR